MTEAAATDNGDMYSAESIKQLLECSICLERFKDPKSLQCQHTFCIPCLEPLIVNGNTIPCPQCRTDHSLSADGISGLSTNFIIVSLMGMCPIINERVSRTHLARSLKQTCAECATETSQSDLTACPHCGDVICPVCSVSHFTDMKASLVKTAQHINDDMERIRDARYTLVAHLDELKQKSEVVKAEINVSVDRFILDLREREKGLCQHVDVYVNMTSSTLRSEIERLEEDLASRLSLTVFIDSVIAKILSNLESSVESLISISAQCSEYNAKANGNLPSSFPKRTYPNVNFVPINAHELSQSILNFGEITTDTHERTPRNVYHGRKGKVLINNWHSGGLGAPSGIALSPDGDRIYVTDDDTLQIFDEQGTHIKTSRSPGCGVGGFKIATGVAVNKYSDVMVSDTDNYRILVFDREGEFKFSFGREGSDDGNLNRPWGLAVDGICNIYVCDRGNHCVHVFQRDGTFIRKFMQPESLPCALDPVFLAIAHATDRVYVTDHANHRVHVYSTRGEYISCFGSYGTADGEMNRPRGISVDDEGYVILVDGNNHRIQVFLEDGTFHCKFGSSHGGAEKTRLSYPHGLAVDKNSHVFVVDRGTMNVIGF